MKRKLLASLLVIGTILAKSQGSDVVPSIVWVTTVGTDYSVSNISTALAANSNVHAAGRTNITPGNADIIVQCTDSSSAVLWTYTYDNGSYDSPEKICVDAAGNTYIAGISNDPVTQRDYICIKLDNTGAVLWLTRYDGGINGRDEAYDLCVDISGDVYVTGTSKQGATDRALTLKLDGNTGSVLWTNTFSPGSGNCKGVTMVLANNQADLVIGADADLGSGTTDIAVYNISSGTGSTGWQQIFNGTNNSNDVCSKLILAGGNVVMCGMLNNSGSGNDYTTIKMDAVNGSVLWQNDYDFSINDKATDLVRDSAGNIAVTGYVRKSVASVFKYHTLCYDSTGAQLWLNQKDIDCASLNVEPSIVCDTIAHHFYVSGEQERLSRDIVVYQITPGGLIGWEKNYDANGLLDAATSLVVNGIGVVFVAANTAQSAGVFQISTLKIAQTPVYFPPDLGTPELNDHTFLFQKNHGQLLHPNGTPVSSSDVGYYNQGHEPSYYFNNSLISYLKFDRDSIQDSTARVDLKFIGSNPLADIYSYDPVEARKHYFTTSTQGITDVRSYERIFIPEVYANVDLHHYSNTAGLKSYFVFKTPGESIAGVRFSVDGANNTSVDANGNLIASTDLGDINIGQLTAYQAMFNPMAPTTPVLVPLTASWNNVTSSLYNFNVSGYVPFWPVVVYISKPGATTSTAAGPNGNLWWATFIGDQGNEQIIKNKVDAKDNFYIGGYTSAANYPTSPGTYTVIANNPSSVQYGIVNRFRNDGQLIYGTYYGGRSTSCTTPMTQVLDLAIDSIYSIYIVGLTTTNDMPIQTKPGAINFGTNGGNSSGSCQDAFIAKFNPQGNVLHFSSYYGGTSTDKFNCVGYWNGQIYIGGSSQSPALSLVSPQPNTTQFTSGEGMYVHLDTAGVVKHSTKLHNPIIAGDVDKHGNYYMLASVAPGTGTTAPVIAPAANFYTSNFNGNWDWGLQRMTPNDSLNWSTFIGGSSTDNPVGISIRDSVMALCGSGSSNNFTFVVAPGDSGQTAFSGFTGYDIQMMKFDITRGQILWSAYHGTNRNEEARGVTLDKSYNMFVTGQVNGSSALSTRMVNAAGYYNQNTYIGTDGIVLGYSSDNKKKWATFYGSLTGSGGTGLDHDSPTSIVANHSGKLFISGMTNVKNNSLPLVKWNTVCYWDSLVADISPSTNSDGFIAMFETSGLFPVGIKENGPVSAFNGLLLYPNPNSGIFNIRFTETPYETVNISVMNVMGQKVFEQNNLKPEGNEVGINLGDLSKGIYLINVSDRKSRRTIKFVLN